jgi:hypothetical protein
MVASLKRKSAHCLAGGHASRADYAEVMATNGEKQAEDLVASHVSLGRKSERQPRQRSAQGQRRSARSVQGGCLTLARTDKRRLCIRGVASRSFHRRVFSGTVVDYICRALKRIGFRVLVFQASHQNQDCEGRKHSD